MMTLSEVIPPEGIPSSSTHTTTLDPQKSKVPRRRRIEINKLKSSCKDQPQQNDVVYTTIIDLTNVIDKTKRTTCGSHGVVSVMGRRREMEDTVRIEKGFVEFGRKKFDFYGVYDGHGGSHVAESCRDRVHEILKEEVEGCCGECEVEWGGVMGRCFERIDNEVGGGRMAEDVEEMTVGSTVVVAVVGVDEIVVANCGDSRAVLCRNGVVVPLSFDHKVTSLSIYGWIDIVSC